MKILAFAEQRDGAFKKSAYEAIAAARSIADARGGSVVALTVSSSVPADAAALGGRGADEVISVADDRLAQYSSSATARAVAEVATAEGADIVVVAHSQHGKDVAPRVAVALEAGYVPDVVSMNHENVTYTRPVYAGKARSNVTVATAKTVLSVRPNVFAPIGSGDTGLAPTRESTVSFRDHDFSATVVETKVSSGVKDVADADVVVSGGRGLKGPENFHLVEELAAALDGAVGASRAVVDAGWRPHSEQVGQTGKTVSPSLYVACAISGAVQHLAGMSSSKYIVAINKDAEAPIFSVADYGIIGDVFEILPALTSAVKSEG